MKDHVPIGIDGEGYTDARGRHRYTFVAACSSTGPVDELYAPKGVRAEEVFEWLLGLPKALLVGFFLGYDRTMWMRTLPNEVIYGLLHPEPSADGRYAGRMGRNGPRPLYWEGYALNLISGRFSVRGIDLSNGKLTTRTVWDLSKFYQCAFVKALRLWKVGDEKTIAAIERMKKKRGDFAVIGPRERSYCRSECMLLAQLAEKLIAAHDDVGLRLSSFFGPGSTASVMLGMMGAEKQRAKVPKRMAVAVDSAFFGGRFEHSRVGVVR